MPVSCVNSWEQTKTPASRRGIRGLQLMEERTHFSTSPISLLKYLGFIS